MKNSKPEKIIQLILMLSLMLGQDYEIQFSHIPIGQGVTLNDSVGIMNSIGGVVSKDASSDSFLVGAGFIKVTQNVLAEPPVISEFYFPTIIEKNGEPVTLSATIYDLNGIGNADLHLQVGGSEEEVILPMSQVGNNDYEVSIPDSLIDLNNFRARIVSMDNMSYSTTSDYGSTEIQFNNSELKMDNDFSSYPDGIDKNEWKLVSWPSQLKNTTLASSTLEDGHVFYAWEPVKETYSIATRIKKGNAYWFRHEYKDPILFEEDTSFALPLNNFVMDLEAGWNLISNPFSFPVTFTKDSLVSDPITYGIPGKGKGWSGPQNELDPWNGYAVYTAERASMTLLPFQEQDSSTARPVSLNEWYLNIKLESDDQINYAAEIGRRNNANDSHDKFDTPMYPEIDQGISIAMDLNGNRGYDYIRDIRSMDEFNGVWNLRLGRLGREVLLTADHISVMPEGLHIGLVDIVERKISLDLMNQGMSISNNSYHSYDIKIVAGDQEYVNAMSQEILSNIPENFSLGQNYPNPFNPVTRMDYTIPQRSKVVISIYNVLGQEIINLVNREQDYGYHSIIWDGIDAQGRDVASGVYFTQMTSKGFSQTKKMLLLK